MTAPLRQTQASNLCRTRFPDLGAGWVDVLLSAAASVRTLEAASEVIRDGERTDFVCLLLDGCLIRQKILQDGRRQILGFCIAGDVPDLQSLFLGRNDHSLVTLVDSTLMFLSQARLRALLKAHPDVQTALLRHVLAEAAAYRECITSLGRRSAFERLGHLFCEIYRRYERVGLAEPHTCPLPATQTDLGDALGLSTVHVNRTLQDMRARKLVQLRNGLLTIDDWDGLVAISGFKPNYLG
ncbi:Crp/Fnr family transcriptional regulator [Terrihabitans sp. B22-R8]|uniref:Crp/Fnr family transcriptional regulator n=1 Tax=Terrihabitans sp. B22-R8 TaxID=3425128 RepID=UPI00403C0C30